MNVLFVAPISGNGGIQSWTRKFLQKFQNPEIQIHHLDVSQRRSSYTGLSIWKRIIDGFWDLVEIRRKVINEYINNKYDVFYTTTSGSLGSLRDLILCKLAHDRNVKTILHCHYGCLVDDYKKSGFLGWLLRKTLRGYDQVWVLDKRTYCFLDGIMHFKGHVFLTPNFIDAPDDYINAKKKYRRIAFVGNLLESKGLFDVIKALQEPSLDAELDIVGPGTDKVVSEMLSIIGDDLNTRIRVRGRLSNNDAVSFMKEVDIIALPTYFKSEAFPISILEAMSLGKMVITTRRAAIPDMLTDINGHECACFVQEKSPGSIIEAIQWCQSHSDEADEMCMSAYNKVKSCYDTAVVMDLYKSNFCKLV